MTEEIEQESPVDDGARGTVARGQGRPGHGHLFSPVDRKQRVFAKVTKTNPRDRLSVITEGDGQEPLGEPADYRRIRELAADALPAAMVIIHSSGAVALANSTARRLFNLSAADIGRPFQDLDISFFPVELRSALEQVQKEEDPLLLEQVSWPGAPDGIACVDIHVVPIVDAAGAVLGVALTCIDVSLARRLQDELERSNRDLETAYEELQSTIEELETTNEELQSTNEELETMNAELQTTNDGLQTISDELRSRTGELDEVNDFLESMLISQRGGFVVIDRDLRVSVWNDRSAELWGVRPDEAPGQHFLNLDIGLPVDALREPIMAVLAGKAEQETLDLDATNRRGREIRCRVSLTPLRGRDHQIRGVTVLVEEATTRLVDGAAGPDAEATEGAGQNS